MANTITILIDSEQFTYERMEDVPESFDYLIKFDPEYPEPPHTEEQHAYISSFPLMMQELTSRETRPYAKANRTIEIRKPKVPLRRNDNG